MLEGKHQPAQAGSLISRIAPGGKDMAGTEGFREEFMRCREGLIEDMAQGKTAETVRRKKMRQGQKGARASGSA